jgi:hypothetical protein
LSTALRSLAAGARDLLADPAGLLGSLGKPKMLFPFAAPADYAPLYYANSVWNAIEGG